MSSFGLDEVVEDSGSDEWREEIDDNFIETFIEYSRGNQVANEAQSTVALFGYVSGLLPEWKDYLGILIRGGTSSGKTHMKQEVLDALFDYADRDYDWLYTTTGGSDKSMLDDEDFDDARIGAFNELQQMNGELREFIKRIVEDGGYTYGRSVQDADSETGRSNVKFSRDPMPVIFSIADENDLTVEAEMKSRMVEIQVDEGPEKNRAVHKMHHGHTEITMPSSKHSYVRESPQLDHAVKKHIKNIPVDTDVVIPTGEGRFDGDDWDESDVTEPMFNFAKSESTRASAAVSSMVKASALCNYHSRDTVEDDGESYIVAEPQDVGNVLATRRVLLATTHNLTEKKFIVLQAFIEEGAPYSAEGASANAKQAEKGDIINYIQERSDIPTFSKSRIKGILNELDEDLVINKMDHPQDARKNIYVYDPSSQFERPAIHLFAEKFADVTDPIKRQPISDSLDEQLADLDALVSSQSISAATDDTDNDSDTESLSDFEEQGSTDTSSLSETAEKVHSRLRDTMHDEWVPCNVVENDDILVTHMLGISPTTHVQRSLEGERESEVDMLVPKRDSKFSDRDGTIAGPEHEYWDDEYTTAEIDSKLDKAIGELVKNGVMSNRTDDMGNVLFTVDDL